MIYTSLQKSTLGEEGVELVQEALNIFCASEVIGYVGERGPFFIGLIQKLEKNAVSGVINID